MLTGVVFPAIVGQPFHNLPTGTRRYRLLIRRFRPWQGKF